jgi:hypothetical protein
MKMAITIASNTNTNVANGFTLAAQGDEFYIPFQTSVFATGASFSGVVSSNVGGIVEDYGAILGSSFGISIGAVGTRSTVVVGTTGTVSGYSTAAISIVANGTGGGFTLDNYGQVTGVGGAAGIVVNGSGQINNTGTISGGAAGISQIDLTGGDTFTLFNDIGGKIVGGYNGSNSTITETISNYGFIRGNVTFGSANNDFMSNSGSGLITFGTVTFGNGNNDRFQNFGGLGSLVMGNGNSDIVLNFGTIGNITLGSGTNDYIGNAGRINGNVFLGNGTGQVFDSTHGTIYNSANFNGMGSVNAGTAGATIVGALNGGGINGGAGNDVLIANQTEESAFNYAAKTTLYGRGGTNALYGGTGTNVFLSGDATYNQIWGGKASFTGGTNGYENNTIDYSPVNALGPNVSVYVDLLNGHNAYSVNAGVFTYADSIVNVPNIIGTAHADVIQCDNGTDRITGGGGGDNLYVGTATSNRGTDTFVYTQYADSNLVTGYDTIVGFNSGNDKIDASALHLTAANAVIQSGASSTVLYFEAVAGTFNANTDLAISFTKANALTAADIIF